jgi:protein-disulfide isomerase
MEENNEIKETKEVKVISVDPKQIAGAIILAGVIIAGAILLKGNIPAGGGYPVPTPGTGTVAPTAINLAPITDKDHVLGNEDAKVTIVMYEDFQCPFCGRFFKDSETPIRDTYVNSGQVRLVYRDFAFLGPESTGAAEAARCAGEQGKFWEYHDYLFTHQNGENLGNFADPYLESFSQTLGLSVATFNQCLTSNRYEAAVAEETQAGKDAGVTGTPKGFILRGDKVVDTIDGAIPYASVKVKIDAALK